MRKRDSGEPRAFSAIWFRQGVEDLGVFVLGFLLLLLTSVVVVGVYFVSPRILEHWESPILHNLWLSGITLWLYIGAKVLGQKLRDIKNRLDALQSVIEDMSQGRDADQTPY